MTSQRPEEQPDFNPTWIQAFQFSPTMNPEKKPQNPNPTYANPDPNGFIEQMAMGSAEATNSDDRSISQLLSSKGGKEEEVSEKDAAEESDMP